MKEKRFNIFIILLAIVASSFGQQEPQFSQYMYTILPINPGYAGNSTSCASLHYRQQLAGFTDVITKENGEIEKHKTSPRDALVSIHGFVKPLHGGLGLTIYQDALGYQSDIAVKLAYSYKLNLGGGSLGIGLSADFLSRQIQKDKFIVGQSGDPQLIASMGESDMHIDFSFGAYYQMQDKWYAGASVTQLVSGIGGDKDLQPGARHLYFLGGYSFELPANPDWKLKPSALIKTDLVAPQIDLTLLADYKELIWFGVSYRMVDAAAILIGAKPFINSVAALRGLEIIGSYDITTSKMLRMNKAFAGRSFGGYEFCIKYCFNIVQPPQIYGYKGTRLLGNKPIEYR
jgi:type IX secretion system PorP/SprF family membrane protein